VRKTPKEAETLFHEVAENPKENLRSDKFFELVRFLANDHFSRGELKSSRDVLERALSVLSTQGETLEVAKCLTWLLLLSIQDGTYEKGLKLGQRAYDILRDLAKPRDLALLQYHLGRALYFIGSFKEAREHLEDALLAFRRLDDLANAARAQNQLARLYFTARKWKLAFEKLESAIEYAKRGGSKADASAFTRNLGTLYLRYGDFERSKEAFTRAGTSIETGKGSRTEVLMQISVGHLHLHLRDWKSARNHLESALNAAKEGGFEREVGKAHEFLGQLAFDQGDMKVSKEHYEKGIEVAREIAPGSALMLQLKSNLGAWYLKNGQPKEAASACDESIRLADALDDDVEKGIALRTLGLAAIQSEETERGIERLKESEAVLSALDERFERSKTLMALASILMEDTRSLDEALRTMERAHRLLQSLGSPYWLARSKVLHAEVERRLGHTDRAQILLAESYPLLRGSDESEALEEFKACQKRLNDEMAHMARETSEEFQLVATWGPETGDGFDSFLEEVLRKTGARRGIISLRNLESRTSGREIARSMRTQDARKLVRKLLSGAYAEELAQEGHIVVSTGRASSNGLRGPFAAAPLIVNQEFQGLIYVDKGTERTEPFHQRELNFLALLAGALSLKIVGMKGSQILQDNLELVKELSKKIEFSNIVTRNKKVLENIQLIDSIKDSPIPVLIEGETGTGKELLALAVHYNSHRRDKKFVAVNCAAIPKELVESELFGHEKGAFTGAYRQKIGKFELADGGTLFLDEVSEMDLFVQAKLLRVVEKGEFERVGGVDTLKVDVRVVAATNRNIEEDIESMKFRPDLFYRLGAVRMLIPPLRERPEDIPVLIEHFLDKYKTSKNPKVFTREATKCLMNHEWPGNVRELENEIRRCIAISGRTRQIGADILSPRLVERASATVHTKAKTLKEAVAQTEADLIHKALLECKWNKTKVKEKLGISYPTLLQKIKLYELKP
jgi:Nif-specific regulatory protein